MIRSLILIAAATLPALSFAEDISRGKDIFDRKCSQCHTFEMAQAMLKPKPPEDRPAYLKTFLSTHPPKLTEDEKEVVIRALSSSGS